MRTAFLTTIITATLTLSVQAQQISKTVTLKVIETSDVLGHFFPWDFMEGRPLRGTLTRANSYINREREKFGDNLLHPITFTASVAAWTDASKDVEF